MKIYYSLGYMDKLGQTLAGISESYSRYRSKSALDPIRNTSYYIRC